MLQENQLEFEAGGFGKLHKPAYRAVCLLATPNLTTSNSHAAFVERIHNHLKHGPVACP